MLAAILAKEKNLVRIISYLEKNKVVSGMVIRLPFREKKQLYTTTSYFVPFKILFFINFRTVFTHNSHNNHVFFRLSKQTLPTTNWSKSAIRKPTISAATAARNH